MKINMSNWERVWLALIIGSGSGNIARIRLGNRALDILEFTEEEKEQVSLVQVGPQWQWRREHQWELEFPDDVWQLVIACTRGFQEWPQDDRSEILHDKVVQPDEPQG